MPAARRSYSPLAGGRSAPCRPLLSPPGASCRRRRRRERAVREAALGRAAPPSRGGSCRAGSGCGRERVWTRAYRRGCRRFLVFSRSRGHFLNGVSARTPSSAAGAAALPPAPSLGWQPGRAPGPGRGPARPGPARTAAASRPLRLRFCRERGGVRLLRTPRRGAALEAVVGVPLAPRDVAVPGSPRRGSPRYPVAWVPATGVSSVPCGLGPCGCGVASQVAGFVRWTCHCLGQRIEVYQMRASLKAKTLTFSEY